MSGAEDMVRRAYRAVSENDRELVWTMCAPDVVLHTTVETHHGPAGVIAWVDAVHETFERYTVEVLDMEEIEGRLVVSIHQRGRGGASGLDVDHRTTHVWTMREGLIREVRAFPRREDALEYVRAG